MGPIEIELKLPPIYYDWEKRAGHVQLLFTFDEKTGTNYQNLKPTKSLAFTNEYNISYRGDIQESGRVYNENLIEYYRETLNKLKNKLKNRLKDKAKNRQYIKNIKNDIKDIKNTVKLLENISEFNKEYHLNIFQPGTEEQTKKLEEHNASDTDYEERLGLLSKFKLDIDRGYKYGSGWLIKPLTKKTVKENLFKHIEKYIENLNNQSLKDYNSEVFEKVKNYFEDNNSKQKEKTEENTTEEQKNTTVAQGNMGMG